MLSEKNSSLLPLPRTLSEANSSSLHFARHCGSWSWGGTLYDSAQGGLAEQKLTLG